MSHHSMKIELTATKNGITIRCDESSIEVSDKHLYHVLEQFKEALHEAIYQRWEANKTTDEDIWIIGPSDLDDEESGFAEFIENHQFKKHNAALKKAYFAAYPKANNGGTFPGLQIPYHVWEDEQWDEAQKLAEKGLIENGKDDPHWFSYVKAVLSSHLMYHEDQLKEWQRCHDLGLPILPFKECQRILKKQGIDGFTKMLKLE